MVRQFIRLPYRMYKNSPEWVPPSISWHFRCTSKNWRSAVSFRVGYNRTRTEKNWVDQHQWRWIYWRIQGTGKYCLAF